MLHASVLRPYFRGMTYPQMRRPDRAVAEHTVADVPARAGPGRVRSGTADKRGVLGSFTTFLEQLRDTLKRVFHQRSDIDRLGTRRGLPSFVLREIMEANPLSVCIPVEYGGRGGNIRESLAVLEASSYESLALGLTFGINWALFLQPVAKYADHQVKGPVFSRFLRDRTLGGLMITEPGHGTDALNMQTSFVRQGGGYHLEGTKHWGGLTGQADYWLVAARERTPDGNLKRDIGFFICDGAAPGGRIISRMRRFSWCPISGCPYSTWS